MKKLIILVLATFIATTSGLLAYEVRVSSVEFGGCWIGEEDGVTKISLFEEGKTLRMSKKTFEQIPSALNKYFEQKQLDSSFLEEGPVSFQVSLHCRQGESSITATLKKGAFPFCLNLKTELDAKGQWQVMGVYPNHEQVMKGNCEGQTPGKLLVSFHKDFPESERVACEQDILKFYEQELVQWGRGKNYLSLTLNQSHHYRENEVKEQLLKIPGCSLNLRAKDVEFDHIQIPAGTFFPLFQSQGQDRF